VPVYHLNPAALSDAKEIHALIQSCELVLHGRAQADLAHVLADLSRPGVDPALDVRLARDCADDRVVGWAWVKQGRRCMIDVHPAHVGRGLGGMLLAWAEERSRELGSARLGQTVSDNDEAAIELLGSRGYTPTAHQWLLESPATFPGGEMEPLVPAGIVLRPYRTGDDPAMYGVYLNAFAKIDERPYSFEEWSTLSIAKATFTAQASMIAFAGSDAVGVSISLEDPETDEGYVQELGVCEKFQGRGIAKALLYATFDAFARRGRATTTLWTHSGTGALGFYTRIGMAVRRSDTIYHRAL
jgi:mycothiol synthase